MAGLVLSGLAVGTQPIGTMGYVLASLFVAQIPVNEASLFRWNNKNLRPWAGGDREGKDDCRLQIIRIGILIYRLVP